jgi:hypothetical protein
MTHAIRFSPITDGAVWTSFKIPQGWDIDNDIRFRMMYTMSASSATSETVALSGHTWVVNKGDTPDIHSPDLATTESVAVTPYKNQFDIKTLSNIKVQASDMTTDDSLVVLKLARNTTDSHPGWLEMIQLLAINYGYTSPGDRGIFGGGTNGVAAQNVIDYVTISSAGDASDFGDLNVTRYYLSATSNGTNDRGIFGGGSPSNLNVIEYVTISTPGNATDFGDLTEARYYLASTSDGLD